MATRSLPRRTTRKATKRRRNFESVLRTLIDQVEQQYVDSAFDGYDEIHGIRGRGFKIAPETTDQLNRVIACLEETRDILKLTRRREHLRLERFIRENQATGGSVMSTDKKSPVQVPAGWRAIYRVRCFCEVDVEEPANEYGWNDYGTYEEAVQFIRRRRTTPVSTRIEIVLLGPTVMPFPHVVKRRARSIAEYYARVPRPPQGHRTPDLASDLNAQWTVRS